MRNTKIRVLIVEDSRLYQLYLRKVLERETCMEVVGIAGTGKEAMDMARNLKPDVITLDLNLPDVAEFELLKRLLRHTRIPVIVVSSLPQACERAIGLGARDFIAKISDTKPSAADHFATLLQMKIKMQARLLQIDHPKRQRIAEPSPVRRKTFRKKTADKIIAIGASLGGTESTLEVLRELPPDMPGIVIVQHMQVGYTRAYAMRLNNNCRLDVVEARDGERILPGKVIVAQGGKQMQIMRSADGYYVRCRSGDKVNGFCPSVDVLFSSLADSGAEGIGVILTGMGHDGVQGILKMHKMGHYTIGQDQESCAIFGMPKAAHQANALDELLNPQQIACRLIAQCKNT